MIYFTRSGAALAIFLASAMPSGAAEPMLVAEPGSAGKSSDACANLTSALEKSGDAMSPVTIAQAREYQRRGDEPSCRLALQRMDLAAAHAIAPPSLALSAAGEQGAVSPAQPAPPATRGVSVSQLRSLAVWNDTERLGEVRRVATGPDQKRYVLIATGGFLGIGEKLVALPIDSLRHNGDRLVLPLSEADVRSRPDVTGDSSYSDIDDAQLIEVRP